LAAGVVLAATIQRNKPMTIANKINGLDEFSLLRGAVLLPLHIALARDFCRTKPGDPRHLMLNRLFNGLRPLEQTLCRSEMRLVRAAKRGELLAVVS
jgi:hypothetical protein